MTALVFLLARMTLRRARVEPAGAGAFAVAALFALHPLQTQAVAYISERAEVLAAALGLGSLLLILASDDPAPPRRRTALRIAGLTVLALALAAKATAVVVPLAWLLHAAFFPVLGEESKRPFRRVRARLRPAAPASHSVRPWPPARCSERAA